jgi:hypothetical protein
MKYANNACRSLGARLGLFEYRSSKLDELCRGEEIVLDECFNPGEWLLLPEKDPLLRGDPRVNPNSRVSLLMQVASYASVLSSPRPISTV